MVNKLHLVSNIWINAGILLIGALRTNFIKISIEIHTFSFKKIHLKITLMAILSQHQHVKIPSSNYLWSLDSITGSTFPSSTMVNFLKDAKNISHSSPVRLFLYGCIFWAILSCTALCYCGRWPSIIFSSQMCQEILIQQHTKGW